MITVQNRKTSFLIVFFVYLLATAAGITVFRLFASQPLFVSLFIADIAATVVVFLFSLLFGNASVYDPYWSVQPPVVLFFVAASFRKPLTLAGVLLLGAVLYWAIRLTANWAYTFLGLTHEDWRYHMLREKTGRLYPLINFFGIHLFPTVVVYACILPVAYAIRDGGVWTPITIVGVLLSIFAATLQLVADVEMQRFRKSGVRGFIRVGLWRHSRHPNYLGEILMWWGIAIASLSLLPSQWYFVFGAALNTVMFLFVSIPMADRRQSKKEGYVAYRAETRSLLPFPKHH